MKLTSESKFFLGIIVGTILIVVIAVILLSRPQKPIEKDRLITPATYTSGNKNANVWLVEFSDFECPACKLFAKTIETLINDNKDALLFAHRHYPLPQHLFSVKAAVSAEAAGKQGKFWEMWKELYAAQTLSESSVSAIVKTLGLDEKKFASDSADPSLQALVEQDKQFGVSLGINATPTFFLNGVKLDIGKPDDLKRKVEEALHKN
ncbi:MAG: hypothetical protein UW52_C0054G0008 [Candidatus Gottesmanbacteria bacterium GW2011_GWA1_44_24b]|uniref:Thioredoxin domain-containing protein n=1 Tax=Candidatus Gottesmanbacteria bacterium GW2011_GWA1_44_24b TaxID=1618437 RepID=A0A0G1LG12_9BACT|nr:MAG: hypothetical protein UW52_C0054G0008 [Candidatus Gottesmanbacteria bacterium GW2011_GWA1_44_24b]HCM81845.1 hypothetical protein [Patescibacteria group bacterium]